MRNSSTTSSLPNPKPLNLSPLRASPQLKPLNSLIEEDELSNTSSFTKMMTAKANKIIKLRSRTPIQLSRDREQYSHLLSQVFEEKPTKTVKKPSPRSSNPKMFLIGDEPQSTPARKGRELSSLSPLRLNSRLVSNTDKSFSSVLHSGSVIGINVSKTGSVHHDESIEASQIMLTSEILEELRGSKPKYKFITNDSKFAEIQNLRQQNLEIAQKNSILKREVKHLDEFKLALMKEVQTENFQQKRVDLLKAQISAQRRYINAITSSLKVHREFFGDIKSVLNFLVEVGQRNTKAIEADTLNQVLGPELAENKDAIERVLRQVVKSNKGFEDFKLFLTNFNTIFTNMKVLRQDDLDFHQLFEIMKNPPINQEQEGIDIEDINPSLHKKVKYKQVITEFLKKYGGLFKLSSVFKEFEYQEQASFNEFIKALIKSSSRVEEVLSKLSRFELSKTNPIVSDEKLPKIVRDNTVEFSNYLNSENKIKRTILDKNYIDKLEATLAELLSQVISLHHVLLTSKESVQTFDIINLQETLRKTIEQLICAGIATDVVPQKNTLMILERLKKHVKWSPDNIFDSEKRELKREINHLNFAVLEREDIHRSNTDTVIRACKESLRRLDEQVSEMKTEQQVVCEKITKKLASQMDFLITRNSELMAINRLNGMELGYNKEYIKLLSADFKTLRTKLEDKSKKIENFFVGIHEDLKRLEQGYELFAASKDKGSTQDREKFHQRMTKATTATLKSIDAIFNDEGTLFFAEVRKLDEKFSKEFENIKQDLLFFSKRLADMIH